MLEKQNLNIDGCCLCEEIMTGIFPIKYASYYGVEKRILMQSDNFIVIPSISPICTGHLMLLPKHHYTSMKSCPIKIKYEGLMFVRSLYKHLYNQFGPLFLFEHGVGSLDDVACGINHAHLHFVPLSDKDSSNVTDSIMQKFDNLASGTMNSLLDLPSDHGAYLMFGNSPENMFMVCDNTLQSQLIRNLIANQLDSPNWNWRSLSGRSAFRETIASLIGIHNPIILIA